MQQDQPQLEVQITQHSQRVNEVHEVTLPSPTAKSGEKTLFLVEASQAGVFQIRNIAEAELQPVLGIVSNVLFPYAARPSRTSSHAPVSLRCCSHP
jgi:preprotein translocase subunit SecB